jgi:hypothetical protein
MTGPQRISAGFLFITSMGYMPRMVRQKISVGPGHICLQMFFCIDKED